MEYGLAIGITAIFMLLYWLTREKPREKFTKTLSDEDFFTRSRALAGEVGLPQEHGKKIYDVKSFIGNINKAARKAHNSDIEDLRVFSQIICENKKALKEFAKQDYTMLSELPSIKYNASNLSRAELIIRFALESCSYTLDKDKLNMIISEFNKFHSISYAEIDKMRQITIYLLLEKLSFLSMRVCALINLKHISRKIAKNPNLYKSNTLFKEICKNNLFLYFCAEFREENCPSDIACVYDEVILGIRCITSVLLNSLLQAQSYDFLQFYAPIELLTQFDTFVNAEFSNKTSFLTELGKQSDKLNLDEYVYTYVLVKYLERTKPPKQEAKRLNLGVLGLIFCFRQKCDMLLLARALSSDEYMSLSFGNKQKKPKSILNKCEFENTFAPFIRKNSIELGISIVNDSISICPNLPNDVRTVTFNFVHNNIEHTVNISSTEGEENQLFINNTMIHGITRIKLGATPLNIRLLLAKSDAKVQI